MAGLFNWIRYIHEKRSWSGWRVLKLNSRAQRWMILKQYTIFMSILNTPQLSFRKKAKQIYRSNVVLQIKCVPQKKKLSLYNRHSVMCTQCRAIFHKENLYFPLKKAVFLDDFLKMYIIGNLSVLTKRQPIKRSTLTSLPFYLSGFPMMKKKRFWRGYKS